MGVHLTARLAWHMDGWNGCICQDPASNVYCVGQHSYPGDLIERARDLQEEGRRAGKCGFNAGDYIPPCVWSINAFGTAATTAYSDPPDFMKDGAKGVTWPLPPATVCLWPYDEMYNRPEVKGPDGRYDNNRRLEYAKSYFGQFAVDRSLIFYYANYSNPLNQADEQRYVLVGVSRLKALGNIRYYDEVTPEVAARYAGGNLWELDVTSHYPDEGFRLPYHKYLDDPGGLDKFAFFPENPRVFKYGTRPVSDDDALDLLERLSETVATLQEAGDTSEDWAARRRWLGSVIAELWHDRGLNPGMATVLDIVGIPEIVEQWKAKVVAGGEAEGSAELLAFLRGEAEELPGFTVDSDALKAARRRLRLMEDDASRVLSEMLPRVALSRDQMLNILDPNRVDHGLESSLAELAQDPYVLVEEYVGDDADDVISFGKVDHAVFPSPDLGAPAMMEVDDPRRLRALSVSLLRYETRHTFVSAAQLIHDVNHRLSFLPAWKSTQFTERYLDVDREALEPKLVVREDEGRKFVYWRPVREAEELISERLRSLAGRPDLVLKRPVTQAQWTEYLRDESSELAKVASDSYEAAISSQAETCGELILRPLAVLAGQAGTGKTTTIEALVKGIEKSYGAGSSFLLLAPTGKAADRIRAKTGFDARTVHSFIAEHGWLNDNLTFKRRGGSKAEPIQTLVIDEASMLELDMTATLFKIIDWHALQRLILVGDPNQLPPIGRGKVFAELIAWLKDGHQDNLGELTVNVRQMRNKVLGLGNGILELAHTYLRESLDDADKEEAKAAAEDILQRVQLGGDVDRDLRVVYWDDPEEVAALLYGTVLADITEDTGTEAADLNRHDLKKASWGDRDHPDSWDMCPENWQVISPYRGELFGTDSLNAELQGKLHRFEEEGRPRELDGIMLGDKVLQFRNRGKSNPLPAYDFHARHSEWAHIYNGELGFVGKHAFDKNGWGALKRFTVKFSRKEHLAVAYGGDLPKPGKKGGITHESVEENLELAYAISVHKAQGSEFERVYFVVPKEKMQLLSPELFYTGTTRARKHCTLLIQGDISPLLAMRRRERSQIAGTNSSIFDFDPLPDELLVLQRDWHQEGKRFTTLARFMVRSKSEVIIANMLEQAGIESEYEKPLYAPDGTFYLPDFTIRWNGRDYFWEHWGLIDDSYVEHMHTKQAWYERHFPGQLIETSEGPDIATQARDLIASTFM